MYQNGFLFAYAAPSGQFGTVRSFVEQRGTVLWVNTVVPQTGKAVGGVCPSVVQGCAIEVSRQNKTSTIRKKAGFRGMIAK